MGMPEKSIWISFQYYDRQASDQDSVECSLQQVTLPSMLTFAELKSTLYSWANVEENNSKIIKLRNHNNHLIPLSTLYQGSSKEKPFIAEVVNVHQFCPVEERSLPSEYIDSLKSKATDLEKRIKAAEELMPDFAANSIQAIDKEANDLSERIVFIDRRLDELTPESWKKQIESNI